LARQRPGELLHRRALLFVDILPRRGGTGQPGADPPTTTLTGRSSGEPVMRRIHASFLCLFLALPVAARGDDKEVKEVLERAIKAHGGAAVLAKSAQMKRTDSGTQAVLGKQLPFTSQVVRSLPDRVRLQIEIDRSIKTLIVLDGDKAWESQGGPA